MTSAPAELDMVTEEEMAFLKAALAIATTRSLLTLTPSRSPLASLSALPAALSPRRQHTTTLRPTAPLKTLAAPAPDIEDTAEPPAPLRSLLEKYRSGRGLMVSDLIATEWCENQMVLILEKGKPQQTEAMKAGSDRHYELEKEVVQKIIINTKSNEDSWAVKLMNFIVGIDQLLCNGLTRELPVIGVVEGVWMTGVIDEIRMPINEVSQNPILVDTKTRNTATLPSEAQKRNGSLQLMCYKYLWDTLVTVQFPKDYFYSHFKLNPQHILSEDVRQHAAELCFNSKSSVRTTTLEEYSLLEEILFLVRSSCSGWMISWKIFEDIRYIATFDDVVTNFMAACQVLAPSQVQLFLRYELQSDHSFMGEYQFPYDADWFRNQTQQCLEVWHGKRTAGYVPDYEKWKCRFCKVSAFCPNAISSSQKFPKSEVQSISCSPS